MPAYPLTKLEQDAWEFAKEAHSKAFRKLSGLPYFDEHVKKVFDILKKYDLSAILGAAAILHDTLEDVDWVTYELIKEKFGQKVADIVKELTSDKEKIKEMGKGEYLLEKMLNMSDSALTIKLCDRLQNLSDMAKAGSKFREKYLKETFFIIEGLKNSKRIYNRPQRILLDQIEKFVENYKKWFKIESRKYMKYLKLFEDFQTSEDDIVKCITQGGTIEVERIQGLTVKPKGPVKPLSYDDFKVTVDIDNENYEVELDDIKRIILPKEEQSIISESVGSFGDNSEIINIQKDDNVKYKFPEKLQLYTTYGTHDYVRSDVTREPTLIRANYYTNTSKETGGNVLADGDPNFFAFDIHFTQENQKSTKLNVDVTYGDCMIFKFTLEAPDKLQITYYNGIDSKYDSDTHYGFCEDSIKKIVNTFNSFDSRFKFNSSQFKFMDKYKTSYIHTESAKITPLSNDQIILVVNNNPPKDDTYLTNLVKYLQTRGINNKIVSDIQEMKKLYKEGKVIGVISTGSTKRIKDKNSKLSRLAFKNFKCPFLGICFGFQSMCKTQGVKINRGKKQIQNHLKLSEYQPCKIFKGVDLDNMKLSFSFHDYPSVCPENFQTVGKIKDRVAAIADETKERYGVLFHPEDVEYSHIILDNFIKLCHHGQDEQEKILMGQFESMASKFNPVIRPQSV